jgi:galactokinase
MQLMQLALPAFSAISQGKQQSDMYKNQALIADMQAKNVSAAYGQRELQQRREARMQAGERRAAMAQSGVGLTGSNADIDRQSEILAEFDALNIRYDGTTKRTDLINSAATDRASASNARTTGYLNAAGSILSGVSKYFGGVPSGK